MADKKLDEKTKFETEAYKLGLRLIEDYHAGRCSDRNKTLAAIIELFRISRMTEAKDNGI